MKEKDVIKKLMLLKRLHPRVNDLSDIKMDIQVRIKDDGYIGLWQQIRKIFLSKQNIFNCNPFEFYGSITILVILLISILASYLPNESNNVLLDVKMATAPNQYVKASLALAYAQNNITAVTKNNQLNDIDAKKILGSIALANTQLSQLKLKGEKGKYTSTQCKDLYKSYYGTLKNVDDILSEKSLNSPTAQQLKIQMHADEKKAEQKLKWY